MAYYFRIHTHQIIIIDYENLNSEWGKKTEIRQRFFGCGALDVDDVKRLNDNKNSWFESNCLYAGDLQSNRNTLSCVNQINEHSNEARDVSEIGDSFYAMSSNVGL